jgi:hypothetical protein
MTLCLALGNFHAGVSEESFIYHHIVPRTGLAKPRVNALLICGTLTNGGVKSTHAEKEQ